MFSQVNHLGQAPKVYYIHRGTVACLAAQRLRPTDIDTLDISHPSLVKGWIQKVCSEFDSNTLSESELHSVESTPL